MRKRFAKGIIGFKGHGLNLTDLYGKNKTRLCFHVLVTFFFNEGGQQ